MACAGLRHESFGYDSCIVGPQASEISGPNWRWEELPAHSSAFLGKMAAICKRWKDLQNKSQVHGKWTNCSPSCPPVWTHLDPLFHLEVGTSQTQKWIHPDFVMRVEFQIVQGIRFWVALIHVFVMGQSSVHPDFASMERTGFEDTIWEAPHRAKSGDLGEDPLMASWTASCRTKVCFFC